MLRKKTRRQRLERFTSFFAPLEAFTSVHVYFTVFELEADDARRKTWPPAIKAKRGGNWLVSAQAHAHVWN